jgi:hypothetical protein
MEHQWKDGLQRERERETREGWVFKEPSQLALKLDIKLKMISTKNEVREAKCQTKSRL